MRHSQLRRATLCLLSATLSIGGILNGGGENLHSLTQNLYNARGLVEEARTYWHENTTNKYTATKTYYDHADRPVAVYTSGSPVQHYEYDAKNRQIQSWTTVGSYMLTKTVTTFDENDRPTLATRYEAREGVQESDLTVEADNSVITYTRTWYDKAGRATATADYGTNNTSTNMFVNASAPSVTDTPAQARTAGARVTEYAYDEAGRQNWVKDPAGRVTATEYDGLGRAVLVTENAEGASGEPKQHTAYQYSTTTGQLTAVAAVRAENFGQDPVAFINVDWYAADGSIQVTQYDYGASVVNSAGGWVYNAVSANGSWISDVHYPDPDNYGLPETDPSIAFTYLPDGQVAERTDARGVRLVYEYDSAQRLAAITAADVPDNADTNGLLLNVNTNAVRQEYAYTDDGLLETAAVKDAAGGVLNDVLFQYAPAHRRLVGATQGIAGLADREVEYAWDTPPIDDVVDNLRESVQRLLAIVYAGERTVNPTYGASGSLDDRLNRVQTIRYNSADAVTYRYMGTGRPVGQELGNGVGFDYDAGTGNTPVSKLDRFGRILDIEWTDGSPKLQYQYGYDAAGNRKFLRTGYQLANQDWLYQYDALNRLVAASRGTLNTGGTGFDASPTSTRWELDALGNWSAGANDVSVRTFLDAAAPLGTFDVGDTSYHTDHHDTNQTNEIAERTADGQGKRFGYDAAGNLVFDGDHFYRYDAFNRVVKIQSPGSVHVYPSGELTGSPGPFIRATFEYDALGRRVRTSAIGGTPTRHVYGSGAEVLTEYALQSGGGGIQEAFERDFVWGTGGFPDPVAMVDFTGAGGGQAGLLRPFYYLKDALGSVGALTDAAGAVVERYVYTPYGETTIASPGGSTRSESLYGNPFLWTGQRYDAANKLYHFWARTYSPELGRFLQKDEQGPLSAVDVSLFGDEPPMVFPPQIDAGGEYADALMLYLYAGANPVNLRDPLGLSSWDDWWEEADNLTADLTGQRLYALGAINEGAKWASIGLNTALSIAWGFLPGSGLYDAFQSVMVIKNGKGGFWDAVNIAAAAFPVANFATKGITGVRALFKAGGYASRACNCFVGGTDVDTPEGPVPIEEIQEGDEVVTRDQNQPDACATTGRVSRVFRDLAPVILWLTLANGQALGVTPGHEVWTHQNGWTTAGELEPGDTFADAEGCPVAVLDVTIDRSPTAVYNFEVDGTFTYFAGGVWVHNNSCKQLVFHFHHAVAKFLKGDIEGIIHLLPPHLHQQYHGRFLTFLKGRGLSVKKGQNWDDVLGSGDNYTRAIDALIEYTSGFDAEHGTSLLSSVLEQLGRQG